MGGHSNQLFQYALGRQLAIKNNTALGLDLSWFDEIPESDTLRTFELDVYPLKAKVVNINDFDIRNQKATASTLEKILRKIGADDRMWHYSQVGNGFDPNVLNCPDNTIITGWWQSEKYFPDIRNELLDTIEPILPPSHENQLLIKKINSSESIWVHVRRGDYVSNKHASSFHGLVDKKYYYDGLKKIISKIPKSKLKKLEIFISSNDIGWCKSELKFPYPTTYIDNKLGSEDMRIAKFCKHDIIANSTFSWWGAWLNQNPEKIVIAPKKWFENVDANKATEIVPSDWFRL